MVHKRDTYSWKGQLERAVGKGSWKGQLEKTRSWKVRYEIGKIEVGKSDMKLERLKLESLGRSLKVLVEVGKFEPKLESSG